MIQGIIAAGYHALRHQLMKSESELLGTGKCLSLNKKDEMEGGLALNVRTSGLDIRMCTALMKSTEGHVQCVDSYTVFILRCMQGALHRPIRKSVRRFSDLEDKVRTTRGIYRKLQLNCCQTLCKILRHSTHGEYCTQRICFTHEPMYTVCTIK